ncbi:hypothetical protein ACQP00_40690 [Dactylosporangium sp. CS-047395]|uniref:hypothetical protein n=1 Tax=Dactylosporangium sp. CS-047395 TaxID=3239936 RepID=UPI003D8DF962
MSEALTRLRWLLCFEGNTSASSAFVVPMLVRIAADTRQHSRVQALQLVGDLARVHIFRMETRGLMLQTMGSTPVYDASGYTENWAVDAVRMMVGRDAGPLIELLHDNDPQVRGRAIYALVTALPVDSNLLELMRHRLTVEEDAAVRLTLVVGIAQHFWELDQVPEALDWSREIWSNPGSSAGLRLGGAIAWLNLTDQEAAPELRRVLDQLPLPLVRELSLQLPWISWLSYPADGIDLWWQQLTDVEGR